jgi:hypothetical protein
MTSPVVIAHLVGMSDVGVRVGVAERVDSADDVLSLGAELRERLQKLGAWLAHRERRPLVALEGEHGSGRLAAAAWLCASLQRGLLRVDLGALAGDACAARRIVLHARVRDCGIYLSGWSPAGELPRELFEDRGAWPLLMGVDADDPWRTAFRGQPLVSVRVDELNAPERAALWEASLSAEGLVASRAVADEIAERFAVRPGVIRDAARVAAAHHALASEGGEPDVPLLLEATKEQLGRSLGKLAVRLEPRHGWSDLVLPRQTLSRVRDIGLAIRQQERVYYEWGFSRHVGQLAGLAIMFTGASGTGKTMTAGVIAADIGLDLYRIDLSGVVSKYIGETEKNLDLIFAAARSAHAVLFFDEADALFGKRSEVRDAHDRYANIEVAYLLQKLEQHPGVVILASNIAKNVDAAFLRRLQYIVDFPKPDEAQRRQLWSNTLGPRVPLARDVDIDFLSESFDTTGGDIRTVALDAAFVAAAEERAVCMADLVNAMARQLRKEGRLPAASAFKQYLPLLAKARL